MSLIFQSIFPGDNCWVFSSLNCKVTFQRLFTCITFVHQSLWRMGICEEEILEISITYCEPLCHIQFVLLQLNYLYKKPKTTRSDFFANGPLNLECNWNGYVRSFYSGGNPKHSAAPSDGPGCIVLAPKTAPRFAHRRTQRAVEWRDIAVHRRCTRWGENRQNKWVWKPFFFPPPWEVMVREGGLTIGQRAKPRERHD